MDVMKNKKVAYCVDFVTVHHCTKFRSHICNIGDFTEGALCVPPVLQGSKKPGINRVNKQLYDERVDINCNNIRVLDLAFLIHLSD